MFEPSSTYFFFKTKKEALKAAKDGSFLRGGKYKGRVDNHSHWFYTQNSYYFFPNIAKTIQSKQWDFNPKYRLCTPNRRLNNIYPSAVFGLKSFRTLQQPAFPKICEGNLYSIHTEKQGNEFFQWIRNRRIHHFFAVKKRDTYLFCCYDLTNFQSWVFDIAPNNLSSYQRIKLEIMLASQKIWDVRDFVCSLGNTDRSELIVALDYVEENP